MFSRIANKSRGVVSSQSALVGMSSSVVLDPRGQTRDLNIHEYQSQNLMKSFGVNVPRGKAAKTPQEARQAAEELAAEGVQDFVVKAQVLAGGRGLGKFTSGLVGGVHITHDLDEVESLAGQMLGQTLVTKQTGADGKPCNEVYLCERKYLRKEMYLSMLLDRSHSGPVVVASPKGGVDIENVAATTPEHIHTFALDINEGLTDAVAADIAKVLGFEDKMVSKASEQLHALYTMFEKTDCTMLEINPFAETPEGEVLCMDAKLNFDDNADFRHKDIFALRDRSQEDPREVKAAEFDLNYIGLDGNIGCLVNGAGLAMATMDIITHHGGSPANFLDVGGGATDEQVTEAFRILNDDPNVRAIFINIFGGIMRCDIIALGIINAATGLDLKKPIVARLQGTNSDEAARLLDESGMRIIADNDLDSAASKAVKISEIIQSAQTLEMDVSFQLPL